jgi:glutamate-1-semialdehyde 2,1-aminomutase
MIAGYTLLRTLKEIPSIYDELEEKGRYLEQGLHRVMTDAGIGHVINRFGSMISVHFSPSPVTNFSEASAADNNFFNKFFHAMLRRGIYLPPSAFESWFLSNALSFENLDETISSAEQALKEIQDN